MATFFIDFENSKDCLKGAKYLNASDKVYLYYSNACVHIRRDDFEEIKNSGCQFEIYKLVKIGENALDFYIAAEAGAAAERGDTIIAFVTGDKGFNAIIDYLLMRYGSKTGLLALRDKNIEQVIGKLPGEENEQRKKLANKNMGCLNLDAEKGKNDKEHLIKSVFSATDYAQDIGQILLYASANQNLSNKERYTNCLHRFGRIKGIAIYKILKDIVFDQNKREPK